MTITYDDIGIYDEQGYAYDGGLVGPGRSADRSTEVVGAVAAANQAGTVRGRDNR